MDILGKWILTGLCVFALGVLMAMIWLTPPDGSSPSTPEALTARYTLWLAVGTALLAVAAIGQMIYLHRAEATSRLSADAAQKSAEIAQRALTAGQRAFVHLASLSYQLDTNEKTGAPEGFSVRPIWKNAGLTPTRDMQNYVSLKWWDGPMPANWKFPNMGANHEPVEKWTYTPLAVAPQATKLGQLVGAYGAELMDAFITGKMVAYVWGWASYRDVFPDTLPHVYRFAVRVHIGQGAKGIDGKPTWLMSFDDVERFNCSDEECAVQGFPLLPSEQSRIEH